MSDESNEVRDDRKYTTDHEWVLEEGNEFTIGISAFAVGQLGDITMVNIDVAEGDQIEAGKPFGTIESVKTLSDLFAPVGGKIARVNAQLEDQPELINEDCWDEGWMLVIESEGEMKLENLMEPSAYESHLEEQD
jgi:glycine cleavage system H protein